MAAPRRRAVEILAAASAGATPKPSADAEQVTQKRDGDVLEARSTSRRIKTVEDLLRHIEADLERYEVAASEATKWECATAGDDGEPIVTELHRVFVRLKPRGGPTTKEIVEAMIAGAAGGIRRPLTKAVKAKKSDAYAVLVVADTHVGKYAWAAGTGHDDYDIAIAAARIAEASGHLLDVCHTYKPARILVAYLGDLFHADTPGLTTTGGTALAGSTDGRLQKMINEGTDALLAIVEKSAAIAPTDALVVNGNHDETLSWAYQRIMRERFRNDRRVTVSGAFTGRQYVTCGKNLLGFAHGHRAKKKLPQLMALEQAAAWSTCPYREWHTGHLHHQAAEWSRPIETIDGVLVRIAPSLSAPDDYHTTNGWVGQREAMECFLYDARGGITAMHVAGPRLDRSAIT
jgi:hypothetical protein